MPIFEFDCLACGTTYEKLVRSSTAPVAKIACPSCGSTRVMKKVSTFAARNTGGAASASSNSGADCAPGGT